MYSFQPWFIWASTKPGTRCIHFSPGLSGHQPNLVLDVFISALVYLSINQTWYSMYSFQPWFIWASTKPGTRCIHFSPGLSEHQPNLVLDVFISALVYLSINQTWYSMYSFQPWFIWASTKPGTRCIHFSPGLSEHQPNLVLDVFISALVYLSINQTWYSMYSFQPWFIWASTKPGTRCIHFSPGLSEHQPNLVLDVFISALVYLSINQTWYSMYSFQPWFIWASTKPGTRCIHFSPGLSEHQPNLVLDVFISALVYLSINQTWYSMYSFQPWFIWASTKPGTRCIHFSPGLSEHQPNLVLDVFISALVYLSINQTWYSMYSFQPWFIWASTKPGTRCIHFSPGLSEHQPNLVLDVFISALVYLSINQTWYSMYSFQPWFIWASTKPGTRCIHFSPGLSEHQPNLVLDVFISALVYLSINQTWYSMYSFQPWFIWASTKPGTRCIHFSPGLSEHQPNLVLDVFISALVYLSINQTWYSMYSFQPWFIWASTKPGTRCIHFSPGLSEHQPNLVLDVFISALVYLSINQTWYSMYSFQPWFIWASTKPGTRCIHFSPGLSEHQPNLVLDVFISALVYLSINQTWYSMYSFQPWFIWASTKPGTRCIHFSPGLSEHQPNLVLDVFISALVYLSINQTWYSMYSFQPWFIWASTKPGTRCIHFSPGLSEHQPNLVLDVFISALVYLSINQTWYSMYSFQPWFIWASTKPGTRCIHFSPSLSEHQPNLVLDVFISALVYLSINQTWYSMYSFQPWFIWASTKPGTRCIHFSPGLSEHQPNLVLDVFISALVYLSINQTWYSMYSFQPWFIWASTKPGTRCIHFSPGLSEHQPNLVLDVFISALVYLSINQTWYSMYSFQPWFIWASTKPGTRCIHFSPGLSEHQPNLVLDVFISALVYLSINQTWYSMYSFQPWFIWASTKPGTRCIHFSPGLSEHQPNLVLDVFISALVYLSINQTWYSMYSFQPWFIWASTKPGTRCIHFSPGLSEHQPNLVLDVFISALVYLSINQTWYSMYSFQPWFIWASTKPGTRCIHFSPGLSEHQPNLVLDVFISALVYLSINQTWYSMYSFQPWFIWASTKPGTRCIHFSPGLSEHQPNLVLDVFISALVYLSINQTWYSMYSFQPWFIWASAKPGTRCIHFSPGLSEHQPNLVLDVFISALVYLSINQTWYSMYSFQPWFIWASTKPGTRCIHFSPGLSEHQPNLVLDVFISALVYLSISQTWYSMYSFQPWFIWASTKPGTRCIHFSPGLSEHQPNLVLDVFISALVYLSINQTWYSMYSFQPWFIWASTKPGTRCIHFSPGLSEHQPNLVLDVFISALVYLSINQTWYSMYSFQPWFIWASTKPGTRCIHFSPGLSEHQPNLVLDVFISALVYLSINQTWYSMYSFQPWFIWASTKPGTRCIHFSPGLSEHQPNLVLDVFISALVYLSISQRSRNTVLRNSLIVDFAVCLKCEWWICVMSAIPWPTRLFSGRCVMVVISFLRFVIQIVWHQSSSLVAFFFFLWTAILGVFSAQGYQMVVGSSEAKPVKDAAVTNIIVRQLQHLFLILPLLWGCFAWEFLNMCTLDICSQTLHV